MRSAVVIAPSLSSNALGRALAIGELLGELAEVRVCGQGRGQLWAGAAQHRAEVRRVSGGRDLVEKVAALPEPRAMWVVKAMPPSWGLARTLSRALPETAMVLDLDDDDEALAAEFRARSVGNRLRLNRLRAGHPGRIRRAMEAAVPSADGFTYSSRVLAEALELPADRPRLCVPHPRFRAELAAVRRKRDGGRVHVGCLGTLREHKGIDALDALLALEPSLVLHVFEGAPERLLAHGPRRVIAHDGATPLEELYGEIDVTLLPQDTSRGARLQLPAKLLDAMRFGVPVMATPTPAIEGAAAGAYRRVVDWHDGAEVVRGIRECAASRAELGERGRARFEREVAIEAQRPRVADFTTEVIDAHLAATRRSSSSR